MNALSSKGRMKSSAGLSNMATGGLPLVVNGTLLHTSKHLYQCFRFLELPTPSARHVRGCPQEPRIRVWTE